MKDNQILAVFNHSKVGPTRRLISFSSLVKEFPLITGQVEYINVSEFLSSLRVVSSIDVHFIPYNYSSMRINFRDFDRRRYALPISSHEVKDIDDIVTNICGLLASKQVQFLFVGNSCMIFQLDFLPIASIVNFLPEELLTAIWDVHLIEIIKDSLVYVVAAMDVERVAEDKGNMIWSTTDVLAFDFDLGPTTVKRVTQLSVDD